MTVDVRTIGVVGDHRSMTRWRSEFERGDDAGEEVAEP
jgi:hypothetical protein